MTSPARFFRRFLKHYVLLLPFFILFAIFYLYPLVYSIVISLMKWDGIHVPVFVDIQNYIRIVNQPRFLVSMLNLGRFVLIVVPAEATEVGMLFVRCGAGGVSHNPAETVSAEDAGLAVAALREFLGRFRPA